MIFKYGSQGKSQEQPNGDEGHNFITTEYSMIALQKVKAPHKCFDTFRKVKSFILTGKPEIKFQQTDKNYKMFFSFNVLKLK